MTSPSKFITSSDYASTPAPLTGAREIVLTTTASQYISARSTIEQYTEITVGDDFDFANYIITCDEEPTLCAYNWFLVINQYGTAINALVQPIGNKIRLSAIYTSIDGGTFTGSYTFRAVVIPMKSPYNSQ